MRIVLSGYGKMGKEVEKVARSRGHEISAVIDRPEDWETTDPGVFHDALVMDFSTPAAAVGNIRKCFDLKVPVVIGTTGWNDRLDEVRQWVETERQAIFFASNFSIGMNLMFEVARVLARMLNRPASYEVTIEETHHIHKLDAPSGTAIKLAEIILAHYDRKSEWVNRPAAKPGELAILSHRFDEVPGIHTLLCESSADRLLITHEAKDRSGLASGAVMAAEWLKGKQGFFEMKDMLQLD